MSPRLTRTLIPILIGVLASFGALTLLEFLRRDQCLDAGGQWDSAAHQCAFASTVADRPALIGPRGYLLAAAVAVAIAFVLWRIYTFRPRGGGTDARRRR